MFSLFAALPCVYPEYDLLSFLEPKGKGTLYAGQFFKVIVHYSSLKLCCFGSGLHNPFYFLHHLGG